MDVSRRNFLRSGVFLIGGTASLASTGTRTGLAADVWSVNDVAIKNVKGDISQLIINESDLAVDFEWRGIDNADENVVFKLGVWDSEQEKYISWNGSSGEIDLGGKENGSGRVGEDVPWADSPGDINLLSEGSPLNTPDFEADEGETVVTDVKLQLSFMHSNKEAHSDVLFSVEVNNTRLENAFTDNLAVWYRETVGSGATVEDSATEYADSTAQDGNISGATWSSDYKYQDYSLHFSGSEYIEVPYVNWGVGESWTFMAWIKWPNINSNANTIFGVYDGTGSEYISSTIYLRDDRVLAQFDDQDDNGVFCIYDSFSTHPWADGDWHHIAVEYDEPNSRLRLLIDGSEVLQDTNTSVNRTKPWDYNPFIGAQHLASSGPRYYMDDGYIDDVRIYTGAAGDHASQVMDEAFKS